MQFKIVSWNIWYDGFLEKWKAFLKSSKADIIGLQEVRGDDSERDIISELKLQGYSYFFAETEQVWDGERYRHGPAIFSKFPIFHAEKIQLDTGDRERAAAYAQVDVNGTILHVFNAHLVHTHQQDTKEQDAQIDKLIARLPSENVIAMGDFNAIPESTTIQKMKKVLIDTDPSMQPTWSKYPEGCERCNPQKVETRLDYIFTSRDLRANSFEVGESDGSDHLPISVKIEFGSE